MTKFLSILETVAAILFGAAISFLAAWYWVIRGAKVKAAETLAAATVKLEQRVVELEASLGLLNQTVNQTVLPISEAFQKLLIDKLIHYHTPVTDKLLVKAGPPNVLSKKERAKLNRLMNKRTKDMGKQISGSERVAAQIVPLLMEFREKEALEAANVEHAMHVVLIPRAKSETVDAKKG